MNKNLTFKKDDITFDITTRAENVRLNGSNVKNEIERINTKIESLSIGEGGGIIVDNSEHNSLKINSEEGAHNFRFHNNKFSHKNEEGEWEDIEIVGSSSGGSGGSGIKLPPTKFIEITSNDTSNIIKWEDANNQVLNGTTISTWAGTKLIRKIDSPPTNEYDGEVLVDNTERDFYKITGFVDEDIRLDTIYYYALFPYSTDGTYNYDISNIRKFYKNSAAVPENTTGIQVIPDRSAIKLKWSDGQSTLNSLWAGTKVVRKIGSPPTTETDGTLIIDNINRDKYKTTYFVDDTATQNVEYFYGFFPYSRDGHYNTNIENVASGMPSTGKVYTVSIDMNNQSPVAACTYLDDAVNISAGDAWDRIDIFQNLKPCLFKNGMVNYYLNKNDKEKKIDGTPSNLDGVDGDGMLEVGFMCAKTERKGNILNISISSDKQLIKSDLGFKCYPFYDKDGNIADKIYVGLYQGYIDSGVLFSNSGKTFTSANKYSINQIFDACKSKGEYYLPYSLSIHELIIFLYTLRFRTRSYIDYLNTGLTTYVNETGTLNKNGMWHKGNAGKWLGIEWGITDHFLFLAGAMLETDVSGTTNRRYLTLMHPKNFYKTNEKQTEYLSKTQFSIHTSSASAPSHTGYTKFMDALNGLIFPSASQTGGSSSTCFVNYCAINGASITNSSVLYVKTNQTPVKSPLNLTEIQATGSFMTTQNYCTYLTYVKGEAE